MAEYINKFFTDYNGFRESFKKAVLAKVNPGWIWLGLTKDSHLVITSTNNEDNTLMHGNLHPLRYLGIALIQCTPVLGLDLWEHAYFTQYEGSKDAYVDAFWRFVDWEVVSNNFEQFTLNSKVGPLV